MDKAKVYFTKALTPEAVISMYKVLGQDLPGNVAVKVHSGEEGNQNYLRPEFLRPMIEAVQGTVVECNTAYDGARNSTEKHRKLLADHLWTKYFKVDLLDAEGPDLILPVKGGKVLKENHVGCGIANYDSMLVLSHFKGHPAGGYGGALKQLSIGCASTEGKCLIHTGGASHTSPWGGDQTAFTESMAEAGKSVSDYLKSGENIVYINVMNRLSIDCDCDGNPSEPDLHDIGILASTDPVALDQACVDLIYASKDNNTSLINRMESRQAFNTLAHGEEIGLGSRSYQLISLDK